MSSLVIMVDYHITPCDSSQWTLNTEYSKKSIQQITHISGMSCFENRMRIRIVMCRRQLWSAFFSTNEYNICHGGGSWYKTRNLEMHRTSYEMDASWIHTFLSRCRRYWFGIENIFHYNFIPTAFLLICLCRPTCSLSKHRIHHCGRQRIENN